MTNDHIQSHKSFVDQYPTNLHQVDQLIQQSAMRRQGRIVDDVMALARKLSKAMKFALTLELPLFLSPTIEPPRMVTVRSRR